MGHPSCMRMEVQPLSIQFHKTAPSDAPEGSLGLFVVGNVHAPAPQPHVDRRGSGVKHLPLLEEEHAWQSHPEPSRIREQGIQMSQQPTRILVGNLAGMDREKRGRGTFERGSKPPPSLRPTPSEPGVFCNFHGNSDRNDTNFS